MTNDALAALVEPFLAQFFLIEAIAGDFITPPARRGVYDALARVYCAADAAALEGWYAASQQEGFRSLQNNAGYARLSRLIEYARKTGQDIALTERDEVLLAQKRDAMLRLAGIFEHGKHMTRNMAVTQLTQSAASGNLDAMAALAFMEYNGVCMHPDKARAIGRLRLCAKWNNLFGNLMGIAYDGENAARYMGILAACLNAGTQKKLLEGVAAANGFTGKIAADPVARLIEKAFGRGVITRDKYDPAFARAAFSGIVSLEDKQTLLLSKPKEAPLPPGIPLDAVCAARPAPDKRCMDKLPLDRPSERHGILRSLTVASVSAPAAHRPLLVLCRDECVARMYERAIRAAFADEAVVTLDADALSKADFMPGAEHAFLRGMTQTGRADTVFMIRHCENVEEQALPELLKMLDVGCRRRFMLSSMAISLDLSHALPVLFASSRTDATQRIAACCDVVEIAPISAREKDAVVDMLLEDCLRLFGLDSLPLDAGCREALRDYDAEQIERIIDSVLRAAIYERARSITPEAVKEACERLCIGSAGTQFGFVGGNSRAQR